MRFCFIVALLFLSGCATSSTPAPVTGGIPRLVVVIVVDGLPQRQVVDYRDQLAPDGLDRFLARGAWFSDAHIGHSYTVTGPGHATLLTGASPSRTGIIGNEWLDAATGEREYCVADASAAYIGHRTGKLDGTSPKNLKVESLGDVLKRTDPRSKVISISGKDRGAILPAGKSGVAYIYQSQTGEFASSTYYMKDHPKWVKDFSALKRADQYFGKEWKALLGEAAYSRSVADGQKWFARGGKLPKKMGEGLARPSAAYYEALLASPFADDLTLDFARAAIAGEQLGRDGAPDILVVSLSSHDYVNHAYGAESRISHDHLLHLDLLLQAFLLDVDAAVGKDNYVAVLTSDHGFTPAPQHSQALGRDAGHFNSRAALAKANAELARRFGEGAWIRGWSADSVLLNRKLIAEKRLDAAAVAEEARKALSTEPGLAAVYTRAELDSGSRKGAPLFDAMRRSWNREVSGDLQVALKPYWIHDGGPASHGSPHPHDTHVPILFYGPPWVMQGRIDAHADAVDIAPTLARILRVPAPSASEGKVLPIGVPGT
jgi:predicted AlkP superfamily pyrophosphatase or phosphodiesterase